MATENATTIAELSTADPVAGGPKSEGDDHLKMIKRVVQTAFPYQGAAFNSFITASALTTLSTQDNNVTFVTTGTWVFYGLANGGLPPPNGFAFEIDNSGGAGIITFTPQNGQEVDGEATFAVLAGKRFRFVSDGVDWISEEFGVNFSLLRAPLKNCWCANNLTNQTIGAAATKLTFATELADPDAVWDGPNSKFTAPATGIYVFFLTNQALHTTANNKLAIQMYKNGAFNAGFFQANNAQGFTELAIFALSLTAADYVEFYGNNTAGAGKSTTFLNMYAAGWRLA